MHALVVFESMFGNTEEVAQAVAEGLATFGPVDVVEVSSAPTALGDDVELLVAGGPTHAFGMSRASTRRDATERAAQMQRGVVSEGIGIRDWLEALEAGGKQVAAATFDTHVSKPRVPGSAAKAAHRRLRRLGFRPIAGPESFFVEDVAGPLQPGEAERARRWGEQLGSQLGQPG